MPSARSNDPAALAHDLNNLLLAIVNASEAAEAGLSGPLTEQNAALARSGLQTVVLAAQQAATLARAIMDAPAAAAPAAEKDGSAKEAAPVAEAAPHAVQTKPVDLHAFLATHRNLFAALVGKRAIFELDPVSDPPPPHGLADPSTLSRVVGNFIKNAAEALAEHGGTRIRVRVVARQWGGRVPGDLGPAPEGFVGTTPPPTAGRDGVAVEVVDDGPGVPPDVAPTVFSRARTTKATGHGIGLSEAPAMGGCVSSRPAEPHGSVFAVWMPAAKEAPAAEKPAEPPKPAAPAPRPGAPRAAEPGAAILLVDDDPGILQAAAILFRVMGFQPLTATSLEDAVTAFNANAARIRAAVLDANVGDGTSAPLLDAIKGSVPTLPCIIASGYSEQKTATVFAGHRYDAFLGKPYTRSELAGILARFSLVR